MKIFTSLYPPILITERNVTNYELPKLRWIVKKIKRWAFSFHLSSSPLRKTLEKEEIKKSQFFIYRHKNQSNCQPSLHFTICWIYFAWREVISSGTLSCIPWLPHLFWVWGHGHDYERGRWKLDVVTMRKRSSSILCRWIVPGIMLDFQFVAESKKMIEVMPSWGKAGWKHS